MRCIILDLESTGLNPDKGDTIIDVAAIRVGPDGIEERFQSLVHPGKGELTPFIEAMTGISAAMLADAPACESVVEQLRAFVGEDLPVVGHNISFDANFLRLNGLDIVPSRLVDTCDFASIYYPDASSHSLEVLSSYLHLEHTEKHRAMGDVLATYELLRCLTHERDTASEAMQHAAKLVQQKATAWAGRQFFDLQVPARAAQHDTNPIFDSGGLSAGTPEGKTRYILRPSLLRSLQWSTAQSQNTAMFVGPSEADTVRDLVYAHKLGVFFDGVEQFIDPKAATQLVAKEQWADDEALFAFRLIAHGATERYIHQAALGLSHKEKQLLGAYAATRDDVVAILEQAKGKRLYITFHAWHAFKEHLPKDALWIIPDAMRLEVNLHQTAKNYLSMDALTGRLKNVVQRSESIGIPATDLFESLEYVIRYAFQGITKLLRHDQRELVLTEIPELLTQFQQTWNKGLEQWRERLAADTSATAHAVERQRQHLQTMVEDFLAGMTSDTKQTTLCRMSQGILLQQERRSLTAEQEWFASLKNVHLLQGYVDEKFTLFVQPDSTEQIDALPLYTVTLQYAASDRLAANMHLRDIIEEIAIEQPHHVLMCTGSGTSLDKAFEELYDVFHGKTWTVLSSGKTGGRGKVRYSFIHQEQSLLVATAQDARGMGVDADTVILTSLPFAPVMGSYWNNRFGDNNFGTLSMPLLIQQTVDLAWGAAGEKTNLYITDGRLFEKQYGQDILKVLSNFMCVI